MIDDIIILENHGKDGRVRVREDEVFQTLTTYMGTGGLNVPLVLEREDNLYYKVRQITPLECGRLQGFPDNWCDDITIEAPTDEEIDLWEKRWSDWWEVVPIDSSRPDKPKTRRSVKQWLKRPASNSALYKMWGNGVALPCVLYVMEGIAEFENQQEDANDE